MKGSMWIRIQEVEGVILKCYFLELSLGLMGMAVVSRLLFTAGIDVIFPGCIFIILSCRFLNYCILDTFACKRDILKNYCPGLLD